MTWRTHMTFGLTLLAWSSSFLGVLLGPFSFVLAGFGALAPDIDGSEAKIKHLKIGKRFWTLKPFYIFAEVSHTIFGHRGILHSLFFVFILGVAAFILHNVYGGGLLYISFLVGYTSHLLADAFTKLGIPLFYPWKKRICFLPRWLALRTGSWIEDILFVIFTGLFIIWLILHVNISQFYNF